MDLDFGDWVGFLWTEMWRKKFHRNFHWYFYTYCCVCIYVYQVIHFFFVLSSAPFEVGYIHFSCHKIFLVVVCFDVQKSEASKILQSLNTKCAVI